MPFLITCPHCAARIKSRKPVPAGYRVSCPKCSGGFNLSVAAAPVRDHYPSSSSIVNSKSHGENSGPIRFSCDGCRTSYEINRVSAGNVIECRVCGKSLSIPIPTGFRPTTYQSAPEPLHPVAPINQPALAPEPEWFQTDNSASALEPEPYAFSPRRLRPPMGAPSRIIAGIGAGFLFLGLFLPMLHAPMGVWLSFIDVPWKVVTVGFALTDEIAKQPERDSNPDVTRRTPDPTPLTRPEKPPLLLLVLVGAVVYPLSILAAIGVASAQVAGGRGSARLFLPGVGSLGATLTYALSILALNSIQNLRFPLAMLSPGFGWAVLFIGSLMITIAGGIRQDQQSLS